MSNTKKRWEYEELKELSLEAIEEHDIIFVGDIPPFLPCAYSTFRNNYNLNNDPDIKRAIDKNRIEKKKGLRAKWYTDGNATTEKFLYRLMASPEELRRVNQKFVEVTGKDGEEFIKEFSEEETEKVGKMIFEKFKTLYGDGGDK